MSSILCILMIISPALLFVFLALRDRAVEKRDGCILEKSQHIANLFNETNRTNKRLARVYVQSSGGEAYPYDLFMIEYYGGTHPTNTIWLPVRRFLNASDDTIKQILASELENPGNYTIKDWQETVYEFVLRERLKPARKHVPRWKQWFYRLGV